MAITKQELLVMLRLHISLFRMIRGERSGPRLVEKWAKKTPDNPAITFQDRVITYSQLNSQANQVANHFSSLCAKQGDAVAVMMENCAEFLILITGLNKIGVVASLINTHLRKKQLTHALTICSPSFIVASENHVPHIEEVIDNVDLGKEDMWVWDGKAPEGYENRDLNEAVKTASSLPPQNQVKLKFDDHRLNIYTSGTTGLPKAAKVSNRRMLSGGYGVGFSLAGFKSKDVLYVPLPLYHSLAMYVGWGTTLVAGATIAIRRKFSASSFWADAKKNNATGSIVIGELPRYLMAQAPSPIEKEHSIERVITVGLRGNLWEEFQNRFNINQIFEFYGATETNVGIMNIEGRPGMMGKLSSVVGAVVRWDPDTETIIRDKKGRCIKVEEGEEGMLIGRNNVLLNKILLGFDGYLNKDETDKKLIKGVFLPWDEFFVTGDVVKMHEDTWISFCDRSSDSFRWRSENVATQEVESILGDYMKIEEVSVYGVKIPGEEGAAGMAACVFKEKWDDNGLSDFIIDNLPHYARPLFIRICKELPKTSTFKRIKYTLRNEGFNPTQIKDQIYFWDRHQEKYMPLNNDLYEDIVEGNIKL
ncbi:MAG: long-chain-acyl-CoA synthetase [Desulfobacterales bacterium]|nr:long-chain-acyl-CoA synthetase [Desulfobacterales bacterium]